MPDCNSFLTLYNMKFPETCECLSKGKDVFFTFYDFPAEHWIHIRTTNPIESTFAMVWLRTEKTKGLGYAARYSHHGVQARPRDEKDVEEDQRLQAHSEGNRRVTFIDGELVDEREQVAWEKNDGMRLERPVTNI